MRIGTYKVPIPEKDQAEKISPIDFLSIKRNKEELGISDINIEERLYPKKFASKQESITQ